MNYYISDLHFCCASQLAGSGSGYDERDYKTLEEMHTDMLARWNRKVTNGDTVYILGDLSKRGKSEELIALVAQLKGHKILVHGNHDDLSDYRLRQLFEEVCNYKEITDNIRGNAYKLVLCHYPILFWNGQHRGNILLYGSSLTTAMWAPCPACLPAGSSIPGATTSSTGSGVPWSPLTTPCRSC